MSSGLCYCGEPGSPGHAPHDAKYDLTAALARIEELEGDVRDLEARLGLQRPRLTRAIGLWYREHPDSPLPDIGTLVDWLITKAGLNP